LRERGLIREVGVSNHTVAQTRALQAHLPFPIATAQPEFSAAALGAMRDGVLDHCMETGLLPLAWSPLAGGRLVSGDGVPTALGEVLDSIANDHGVSRAVIAVAFVLMHPSAPVAILGTQRIDRLAELSVAARVRLSRSEAYRIIEASDGRPLP
jgi:predicted oxidoreductase